MPETFGRYELRGLLGRGGMGEVFRAYDTVRQREVALKLLPEHLAGDADFQERFRRESQIAARLSAPHVIPIHDFGEVDGRLFIDMRLVQGEDLAAVLRRVGRLRPDVAVELVLQIASALDAAHAGGLVHRDVKPSNVLVADIGSGGRPFAYLVDFGLARPVAQDESELTRTGAVGTLPYLAPERITGNAGDHRADVYALACVLFELVAGRKPWDGDMYTVLSGHLKGVPPRPSVEAPGVAPALDAVVATGMAKRPDDRYAHAGDLARAARDAIGAAGTALSAAGGTGAAPAPSTGPVTIVPGAPRTSVGSSGPGRLPPPPPPVPPTAAPTHPRSSAHPTYPGGHGAPPPSPPRRSRAWAVALAGVLVVVVAVVLGVFVLRDSGTPRADPTTSSPRPTPRPTPTGLRSGTGSSASWSDFASFSTLAGTRDNDTAGSFQGARCTLSGRRTGDPQGLVSEVVCGRAIDSTGVFIGRFGTVDEAQTYLQDLQFQQGAAVTAWGVNGQARGLAYATTTSDVKSLDTTICGLPTYVVRFIAQDPGISLPALREQFWNAATFPDVVPPVCKADLSGSTGAAGAAMTAAKPTVALSTDQIDALLERGSGQDAYSARSPSGTETLLFDQRGALSFWTTDADGLRRTGTGRYPTADPSGDYHVFYATLFDGMDHASFLFRGPFTRAGVSQDIVLTRGSGTWGPLVPRGRTELVVGTFPVPTSGRFTETRAERLTVLQTVTASATTTWKWTGTMFVRA